MIASGRKLFFWNARGGTCAMRSQTSVLPMRLVKAHTCTVPSAVMRIPPAITLRSSLIGVRAPFS